MDINSNPLRKLDLCIMEKMESFWNELLYRVVLLTAP